MTQILRAQDVWRGRWRDGATGMLRWILVLVLVTVGGCGWLATKEPELGPAEVTERFYRWCIGYPGNPVADREYRTSPYLAPAFIERIDATVASMTGGGGDPLLLAQDVPERFEVGEAQISGDAATVPVDFYWAGNDTPSTREVELRLMGGEWKIVRISLAP